MERRQKGAHERRGILGVLVLVIVVGGFLGSFTGCGRPDADYRFISCREDWLKNSRGEWEEEFLNGEAPEGCSGLHDLVARLREFQATYDTCPDPTDPRLVQLRAYEEEWIDESLLYADMVTFCCAGEEECNQNAAQRHLDRIEELDELISQQEDDFNAAQAEG